MDATAALELATVDQSSMLTCLKKQKALGMQNKIYTTYILKRSKCLRFVNVFFLNACRKGGDTELFFLNQSPKFYHSDFLFVGLTTFGTFIEFLLIDLLGSVS